MNNMHGDVDASRDDTMEMLDDEDDDMDDQEDEPMSPGEVKAVNISPDKNVRDTRQKFSNKMKNIIQNRTLEGWN